MVGLDSQASHHHAELRLCLEEQHVLSLLSAQGWPARLTQKESFSCFHSIHLTDLIDLVVSFLVFLLLLDSKPLESSVIYL